MLHENNFVSKFINSKISKSGWTGKDFSEYFGISEDEFRATFESRFSNSRFIQSLRRDLERNEKKQKKKHSKNNSISEEVIDTSALEVPFEEIPEEENSNEAPIDCAEVIEVDFVEEVDSSVIEILDSPVVEVPKPSIESLNAQKEELILKKSDTEKMLYDLNQNIASNQEKLLNVDSELETLYAQVSALKTTAQQILGDINSDLTKFQNVSAEDSLLKEKLEELDCKIFELTSIEVYVYADGTIDLPELQKDCSREGINLMDKIDSDNLDFLENMTIKQIRLLSEIYNLSKNSPELNFKFLFEEKEVEEAFEKLQLLEF